MSQLQVKAQYRLAVDDGMALSCRPGWLGWASSG